MTGSIERYDPTRETLALAPEAWALAQKIAMTDFVPTALRGKPEAVLACILAGHEVGISPMQSLSKIHVIEGRPAMAAELMRALIIRAGHELWLEESNSTSCTVAGKRKDSERETRVTWTMDDARRAKLTGRKNWESYPTAMLLARATAQLCRAVFPDVLAGISYTVEELQDGDFLDVDALKAPADDETPPAPTGPVTRRARAAQAATRGSETPDKTEPDPEPPRTREEPALPGEDDIVDAEVVDDDHLGDDDPTSAETFPDDYEGPDQHEEGPRLTGPQMVAMKFGDRGIGDRDRRLALCAAWVGREITSGNDLTPEETGRILDILNDEERLRRALAETVDKTADEPTPPAEPARRRRIDPPAAPALPEDWTGDEWRAFLTKRGVKVTEAMREAERLAVAAGRAPLGTLDALTASGICADLVGFVEDLALSRKAPS